MSPAKKSLLPLILIFYILEYSFILICMIVTFIAQVLRFIRLNLNPEIKEFVKFSHIIKKEI
jgi:hypothetical protein